MRLLILLFLLASGTAQTQNLFIAPTAESTVLGLQYGASLGYVAKNNFSAGAFYLTGRVQSEVWPEKTQTLYGLQSAVPLVRSPKIGFCANLRVALSNDRFVVLIPGAETRLRLSGSLQAVAGMAWRHGHASINSSLLIKL